MRQVYHPTAATQQLYRTALNNDLGIYHVQHGSGLGSFLKSLMKRVIPIGKSLLKQGFEAAKPALQDLASQGIEAGQKYAEKKIKEGSENLKSRVKRRKDSLS
jgi:hypothetical protein